MHAVLPHTALGRVSHPGTPAAGETERQRFDRIYAEVFAEIERDTRRRAVPLIRREFLHDVQYWVHVEDTIQVVTESRMITHGISEVTRRAQGLPPQPIPRDRLTG